MQMHHKSVILEGKSSPWKFFKLHRYTAYTTHNKPNLVYIGIPLKGQEHTFTLHTVEPLLKDKDTPLISVLKHALLCSKFHPRNEDTSPGPQGCPQWRGFTVYRTPHQDPKVSTMEGFHCIQDTSPGPQGSPQWRGSTVYRTPHQDPKGVHNGGVPLYMYMHN